MTNPPPPRSRIASAWLRGTQYRRALGWRRFLTRLASFWVWLPRLIHVPWRPRPQVEAPMNLDLPRGVNLLGYVSAETGLGEVVRQGIKVLQASDVPFVLNNVLQNELVNNERVDVNISRDNPYAFNLVCVNAAEADTVAWQKGREYFEGRYNIGYWVWEMTQLPPEWLGGLAYYDEIWVPSAFVRDAVASVASVPVTTIPYAIDRERLSPVRLHRQDLGLPPDNFVFLFIFHYYSLFERKNPQGAIKAFRKAFPKETDVTLLIKTAGGKHTAGARELRKAAGVTPGIKVLDQVMARGEINDLYELSNCYVSLHRAEGFGLTMAEAMDAGIPVIATDYGGNVDFMTPSNSYLVSHQDVPLLRDLGPYRKGWTWAEPDLDQAAAYMRHLYDHREEAEAIGKTAQAQIRRQLSVEAIGAQVKARLDSIAAGDRVRSKAR